MRAKSKVYRFGVSVRRHDRRGNCVLVEFAERASDQRTARRRLLARVMRRIVDTYSVEAIAL